MGTCEVDGVANDLAEIRGKKESPRIVGSDIRGVENAYGEV